MQRPDYSFNQLAGVPTHYARQPVAPYGTRGKQRKFYVRESFGKKLDDCFAELWKFCGTKAEVITSAGAWVQKQGMHGEGRAYDIDAIFWPERSLITREYNSDRKWYLGTESILRKYFGTVLNWHYNDAHKDHFHVDDGSTVQYHESSRSRVLFVQAAITEVFDNPITIDGIAGPQTRDAVEETLRSLEIQGELSSVDVWVRFLDGVANKAFGNQIIEEQTPLELFEEIYRTLENELADSEHRKPIEAAVTAFASHPMTHEWLNGFSGNHD